MNKFRSLLEGPVSRKSQTQNQIFKSNSYEKERGLSLQTSPFALLTNSFIMLSEELLKLLSGIITSTAFRAR